MEEKSQNTSSTTKTVGWVSLIFGIILCIAGSLSFFEDETINDTLTEAGAAQIAAGIVSECPSSAFVVQDLTEVLDSAIKARVGDPSAISEMLQKKVSSYNLEMDIRPVVSTLINQINDAYTKSDTEEQFIHKLELIVRGLKTGMTQ